MKDARRMSTVWNRASRFLEWIEVLVPGRIAAEEIGDALEMVTRLVERGCPPWWIYLKTATIACCVLFHAFWALGRRGVLASRVHDVARSLRQEHYVIAAVTIALCVLVTAKVHESPARVKVAWAAAR